MTNNDNLPTHLLQRKAVVYVRQSTQTQVQMNTESQRRQYELVEEAKRRGFHNIDIIDDDLGYSASGMAARPGFDRLVALLCAGEVGAVFCLDASRLARNGRDWHHLLELCGLVEARVIDPDGMYDPCLPNDRLLLGMKGNISEFELNILRTRMLDAKRDKACRGELRISVPVGYIWYSDVGLGLDPNLRLQEVIRLIFTRFRELGSARQVLLSLRAEEVHFPRPTDGKTLTNFDWVLIRYRNVISVLKNPFYAGAYAYGKSGQKVIIVDGRGRKSYKHSKPFKDWDVLLKGHHEGYIDWAEFERNQKQLAINAYGKAGGVKSGRGGQALLAGLLTCARCGRRLSVTYSGRIPQPVYRCSRFDMPSKCMSFGGSRIDAAIGKELLRIVEPMAIEAALQARQMHMDTLSKQRNIIELELQQARYDARLAERRYAACDPDNRLIAAQLEKNWEAALCRVQACETRLDTMQTSVAEVSVPDFTELAGDLNAVWNSTSVTMRMRQQLLRTLIVDIIADVDETMREVILTVHWQGGQHSQLRVRKPRSGEHGCATSDNALAVIRSMVTRWSDQDIAATLNRMGMRTGQGKTWTAHRVNSVRRVRKISAYRSAKKNAEWVTLSEAAKLLGVTHHAIRRLIHDRILPAEQVMPDAPWQIRINDLYTDVVATALIRKCRPCRKAVEGQLPMFIEDSEGGTQ